MASALDPRACIDPALQGNTTAAPVQIREFKNLGWKDFEGQIPLKCIGSVCFSLVNQLCLILRCLGPLDILSNLHHRPHLKRIYGQKNTRHPSVDDLIRKADLSSSVAQWKKWVDAQCRISWVHLGVKEKRKRETRWYCQWLEVNGANFRNQNINNILESSWRGSASRGCWHRAIWAAELG